MNWDDLRFFLAVCRAGSIRGAAKRLDVNHATVSRRINSFESSLNQRLFERSSQGYLLTKAAEEIFQEASHLEERLSSVERMVVGRDKSLTGNIRITAADVILENLLMEELAEFSHLYPQIELEVIDSERSFNLANREADVAIRVCTAPPEHLIGRKLAPMHRSCYIAKDKAELMLNPEWLSLQNWIGWSDKMRRPKGKVARDFPKFSSKHRILSATLQQQACRNGMGIAVLPCFMGDQDTQLVRIPPYTSEYKFDIWILSHPDMRSNRKILAFVRFMTEKLMNKRGLIEGARGVSLP